MPELRRTTNDDFLAKLLESLASDRKEEFCDWVMKTAASAEDLVQYSGVWSEGTGSLIDAIKLCDKLESFVVSFISDPASWARPQITITASKMIAVLDLFIPIINHFENPPQSVFRRLEGCHRNLLRIAAYAEYPKIVDLVDKTIDTLELWLLRGRSDGFQLMANCVINILSKNKIKVAHFKRLVIWKSFFLNFRRPLARRNDQMVLREHFADLEPPEWAEKDDDEESSKSTEPHEEPVMSLMEVEKIDYLADVVLQTFKKSDALGSSEGKKFLAMLLTLGRDFMHLCRIAIYDMMMNEKVTDFLDPLAETVVKAWEMLYKEDHPLRLDLQAIIITDLMERSLKTAPDYKKHSLDKYRKMVSFMHNYPGVAFREMFHSMYDLMVIDGCRSNHSVIHANALHMLGKCFPVTSPDYPRADFIRDQVDFIVQDMKSIFPASRANAAEAAGEMLVRAWGMVPVAELTEVLRQMSERLVFDASSIAVRVATMKAFGRILDQPLALVSLVPIFVHMKEVATDDAAAVRTQYYSVLSKAVVDVKMMSLDGGPDIVDSEQLLVHYTEKNHPYEAEIGHILDNILWDVSDLRTFLKNSLRLFEDNPAVALKFFQNCPKQKTGEEIYTVLNCILSQIYHAIMKHHRKEPDPENAVLSMKKPDAVNNALELAGTIMAATVLIWSKNPEHNADLQSKASQLLIWAMSYTDVLQEIHLYRIACRIPRDLCPEYCNWCCGQFRSVSDENVEDGVAYMTFLCLWSMQAELIGTAREWIELESQHKGKKRTGADSNVKRAHLGLQYLSMILSDADTSGGFKDLDEPLAELAVIAVNAFTAFLPRRMTRELTVDNPFRDAFYLNVITFLSIYYINGLHYKKDLTQFRAHFHDIFLSARDCVCSKLGLGTPANIVFTVQSYKEEGKKDSKNILRKSESYPGHHGIVKLADGILTRLRDVLANLSDVIETEDPEVHKRLRGYIAGGGIREVTLVTPPTVPPNPHPPKPAPPKRRKK